MSEKNLKEKDENEVLWCDQCWKTFPLDTKGKWCPECKIGVLRLLQKAA